MQLRSVVPSSVLCLMRAAIRLCLRQDFAAGAQLPFAQCFWLQPLRRMARAKGFGVVNSCLTQRLFRAGLVESELCEACVQAAGSVCREHTCVTCALTQGGLHTSCGIALTVPTGRVDCYRWVVQWPMHSGFKGSE